MRHRRLIIGLVILKFFKNILAHLTYYCHLDVPGKSFYLAFSAQWKICASISFRFIKCPIFFILFSEKMKHSEYWNSLYCLIENVETLLIFRISFDFAIWTIMMILYTQCTLKLRAVKLHNWTRCTLKLHIFPNIRVQGFGRLSCIVDKNIKFIIRKIQIIKNTKIIYRNN